MSDFMFDKIPFSELEVGTRYLIDCHAEWDTDEELSILDGFTVARYVSKSEHFYNFKDYYGTELYFEIDSGDLRHVYRLPAEKMAK